MPNPLASPDLLPSLPEKVWCIIAPAFYSIFFLFCCRTPPVIKDEELLHTQQAVDAIQLSPCLGPGFAGLWVLRLAKMGTVLTVAIMPWSPDCRLRPN